jgi:hypothetical protein
MNKTIGWAAVGDDGRICTDWRGIQVGPTSWTEKFNIYAYPGPGLVRVEIRAVQEKKRMTGKAGKKRSGKK